MAGPGGFRGFALNQNYFIFMKNFQKNYQVNLTNPPPPPLWKFEPLSRNPGSALADLSSRHTSLTQHRINIDSTPYIESMLSQVYVPAWWSPVYTQKVNRKWDNRENITVWIGLFIEALQHTSGTNQEKGHSASLLSHVQLEQAGLDKQFLESKILSTCLNIRWCSK